MFEQIQIGVLALQGDFGKHAQRLSEMGYSSLEVRNESELSAVGALVIPGGESTVLLKLLTSELRREIIARYRAGMPILATCAGLILLAREVAPTQDSLGLIDLKVERNAYGRQADSFIDDNLEWSDLARSELSRIDATLCENRHLQGVFIRAPRIRAFGHEVEVLASREGEPVLVRQGSVVGATFHPELSPALFEVHQLFLSRAGFH